MPSGRAIKASITRALRKLEATHKVVMFRQTTRTGGNDRLGIGGTVNTVDTSIDPQPAVTPLTAEAIATSGGLFMFGDYKFVFSGAVDESVLRTHAILYGSDVLQIVKYQPGGVIGGTVIAWEVVARVSLAGT